jgi:hypothetical protein
MHLRSQILTHPLTSCDTRARPFVMFHTHKNSRTYPSTFVPYHMAYSSTLPTIACFALAHFVSNCHSPKVSFQFSPPMDLFFVLQYISSISCYGSNSSAILWTWVHDFFQHQWFELFLSWWSKQLGRAWIVRDGYLLHLQAKPGLFSIMFSWLFLFWEQIHKGRRCASQLSGLVLETW